MMESLTGIESQIFYMLENSESKTAEEMSVALGTSKRAIRKTIEQMRLKEIPVCSSSEEPGYWLGKTRSGWRKFIMHQLYTRLRALQKLIEATERAMDSWPWEDEK